MLQQKKKDVELFNHWSPCVRWHQATARNRFAGENFSSAICYQRHTMSLSLIILIFPAAGIRSAACRQGWVMAVIRPESFLLNPCSSTFWGPLRTLCSPLSQVCPEWKINNTPRDGSEFNKDSDLEECHVFFPVLGCFSYLLIQHMGIWEDLKLTAVQTLNTSVWTRLCLHCALPI